MADEDTKPTDGTVADLKEHLDTVTDPAEVEKLKQDEADGKDRATAQAALDAKAAELAASSDADKADPDKTEAGAEKHPDIAAKPNDDGNVVEPGDLEETTLAQAPNPGGLSDTDINKISGDGLKDGASQAQADVAGGLVKARDEANDPDTAPEQTIIELHRLGPGSDIS